MAKRVNIRPMPAHWRDLMSRISELWWPQYPPIFEGGSPTAEDIELALALIAELDDMSQRWYRHFVEKCGREKKDTEK